MHSKIKCKQERVPSLISYNWSRIGNCWKRYWFTSHEEDMLFIFALGASSWRPAPIILHHRIQTDSGAPAHTSRKWKKMTGKNTFPIFLLNDANITLGNKNKNALWMSFWEIPLFDQNRHKILDLEETETHYGKSLIMAQS